MLITQRPRGLASVVSLDSNILSVNVANPAQSPRQTEKVCYCLAPILHGKHNNEPTNFKSLLSHF